MEEDQCCGQSQGSGLCPAVCLSCHDEHLSCPQSVWEEVLFPQLRRAGRGREGENKGVGEVEGGMHERKKKMEGKERRVVVAHRLMRLCASPGVGLSGPLACLCSLALGNTHTHAQLLKKDRRGYHV